MQAAYRDTDTPTHFPCRMSMGCLRHIFVFVDDIARKPNSSVRKKLLDAVIDDTYLGSSHLLSLLGVVHVARSRAIVGSAVHGTLTILPMVIHHWRHVGRWAFVMRRRSMWSWRRRRRRPGWRTVRRRHAHGDDVVGRVAIVMRAVIHHVRRWRRRLGTVGTGRRSGCSEGLWDTGCRGCSVVWRIRSPYD